MKKILYLLLIPIFLFSCLLVFSRPTAAQIPGEGLTISPPLVEITVEAGQSVNQVIKITNPTKKLMEIYPVVMNFGAKGEGGEPTFYPASEEGAKFSLANWIKFSQSKIALTPEQVVEFNYQIQVPEKAEPGGHYGVVFFSTEPPKAKEDANQISISSMVGCLILAKVPGAIVEKAALEEFSAKKFYFKPPVDIITRIKNQGNIHFKPKGEITIKDLWGNKKGSLIVNESKGNVLPESIRKFENQWSSNQWTTIGKFSANLKLTYGESETPLEGQISFWIIPWWLIILAGIILLIVIIIIIILWRRKKRRKKKTSLPPSSPSSPPSPPPPSSHYDLDKRRIILR
jgi:hypothetical protein